MTPYLAQGAAMGIEDAAILGGLLEKYPSKDMLGKTLQLYERVRIERASKVAHASIDSRYFTQMPDGEQQRERDEYLLSHPGIQNGHRNIRSQSEFLDWLFGYDATLPRVEVDVFSSSCSERLIYLFHSVPL